MSEASVAPQAEIAIGDFVELVARMSRFLTGFANMPPFKDSGIGVAEWLALSMLAEKDGVGNKHLAKRLGISGQRINQITTSLAAGHLIAVSQSSEDSRRNVIKLSDAGRSKLTQVNSQILSLMTTALKDRERSLARANRSIRMLARLIRRLSEDEKKSAGARATVS